MLFGKDPEACEGHVAAHLVKIFSGHELDEHLVLLNTLDTAQFPGVVPYKGVLNKLDFLLELLNRKVAVHVAVGKTRVLKAVLKTRVVTVLFPEQLCNLLCCLEVVIVKVKDGLEDMYL